MSSFYDKVVGVLKKPSEERFNDEIQYMEPWFRKKSSLFEPLKSGLCFFYLFLQFIIYRKGDIVKDPMKSLICAQNYSRGGVG